jgi:5-methyltetrahydrofolate--homocysteine methyltransferase
MSFVDEKILLFDGACGTNLQEMTIPDAAWQGCEGCNELLNVTSPETIIALHESFLNAGSKVIETNTFGAEAKIRPFENRFESNSCSYWSKRS